MFIEVEPNPNTETSFNMVYRDISPAREAFCIKYMVGTEDQPVQVTGWDTETNAPCPAYACKVEESGDSQGIGSRDGQEIGTIVRRFFQTKAVKDGR